MLRSVRMTSTPSDASRRFRHSSPPVASPTSTTEPPFTLGWRQGGVTGAFTMRILIPLDVSTGPQAIIESPQGREGAGGSTSPTVRESEVVVPEMLARVAEEAPLLAREALDPIPAD